MMLAIFSNKFGGKLDLVLCLGTYILNHYTNSNKITYISGEEEHDYFKFVIIFE